MLVENLSVPIQERTPIQIQKIKQCLVNVKFLKSYNETAQYDEVVKNLELEKHPYDHVLFR